MDATDGVFRSALGKILTEVFDGPPGQEAYLLNPGDTGLLRQLDAVSASIASAQTPAGKATIAAHVDHIHFGLDLLNRWAAGEANPWANADWGASWKRLTVTDEQWKALRDKLRLAAHTWQQAVRTRTEWDTIGAAGALSSAAHTAYHLGAIRQMLAAMRS